MGPENESDSHKLCLSFLLIYQGYSSLFLKVATVASICSYAKMVIVINAGFICSCRCWLEIGK